MMHNKALIVLHLMHLGKVVNIQSVKVSRACHSLSVTCNFRRLEFTQVSCRLSNKLYVQ